MAMALPDEAGYLRCPECHAGVSRVPGGQGPDVFLCSLNAAHRFPIVDGVPMLLAAHLVDRSLLDRDASRNRADHANWKRMQAWYHDMENAEVGRAEYELSRPFRGPGVLRVAALFDLWTAVGLLPQNEVGVWLSVCCGRGMDAEFMARLGHCVVGVDVSPSSARIASQRLTTMGSASRFYCADAERLPFADGFFDGVLVYDGLHHLPNPYTGAVEMARVSGGAVVIIEPNDSPVVRVLQALGVSNTVEDSGNVKTLLKRERLQREFEARGYRADARYSMHKKWHFPASWMKLLEGRRRLDVFEAGLRLTARAAGAWGNHIVFVATRDV